ncbi:MAG: N-acetyltransferase [Flavobacterium sp.]|nr:MAG: N-acetyltransferase [Flavobacterium sp.]
MNFDPGKNYILENDRVLLRPLQSKDLSELLNFSEEESELWTYSLTPAGGRENLSTYIDHAIQQRELGVAYPFIVFDKKEKRYAGSTRFYDIQPYHNTLQLGYTWYGKEFQGSGLNKNCKFLLLQFAFETLAVDRVEFRADARNARSIAAMKSIGCTEEGILRSNCRSVDGRRDSIVLSILKQEWIDRVKQELKNKI